MRMRNRDDIVRSRNADFYRTLVLWPKIGPPDQSGPVKDETVDLHGNLAIVALVLTVLTLSCGLIAIRNIPVNTH